MERLLGRGGMGVVYLAEDLRLRRRVALKLLSPSLAADKEFRDRFLAESKLAASLDHPCVVPIYEAGESDGQLFIAMRFVEGSDLKTLLRGGPLAAGRWFGLGRQIKALSLSPFVRQRMRVFGDPHNRGDVAVARDLVDAGKIVLVTDRRYALSDVPEALRYDREGHSQENVQGGRRYDVMLGLREVLPCVFGGTSRAG